MDRMKMLIYPKLGNLTYSNIKIPLRGEKLQAKFNKKGKISIYNIKVPEKWEVTFRVKRNQIILSVNNFSLGTAKNKEIQLNQGDYEIKIKDT